MLTSAQPSAMGRPSDNRVAVSQIRPSVRGGKKGPVVNCNRIPDEPKVSCPYGHEVYPSRIPWQAGCRHCHGHNGWGPEIISQSYNQVLDMTPLPWHEAVSDFPHLQVAQFKGKRWALDDQASRARRAKGQFSLNLSNL